MTNDNQNNLIQAEGIEFNHIENPDLPAPDPRLRQFNDFRTMEVTAVLKGVDAADKDLYSHAFHVANIRCFFIEARAKHEVNGGASAAVHVVKVPFNTANKPGQSMLESAFDLTSQAPKVQWKLGSIAFAATQLNPGDAISLRPSGTLTGLKHLTITCLLGYNEKDVPTGPSVSAHIAGL